MNEARKKIRGRYGAELTRQIIAECAEPDASVADSALSHGIHANVVHEWRREARTRCLLSGLPWSFRCCRRRRHACQGLFEEADDLFLDESALLYVRHFPGG